MEGDFIKINKYLLPLSWLYGCGVRLRNILFDVGILKSRSFDIPIISVGNLTVGGTGKTPHVEYLIRLLKSSKNIAVLSRGYKRKTHGFLLADAYSTSSDIGDEPYQMKKKFPDVTFAVDSDRVHGINMLMKQDSQLDTIILDDAYQHRYVKPDVNILLVDYHRLVIYDELLPAGRLREPLSGKNRADIVIITKCPSDLKPMEFRVITKAMDLFPYQKLFFTTLKYEDLYQFNSHQNRHLKDIKSNEHILLLSGIASPQQLLKDLSPYTKHLHPLTFADHHTFTQQDVNKIEKAFAALPSPKCVITTEKDAARIINLQGFSNELREQIYVLPVRIQFMLNNQNTFNQIILDYVRKNSRNSNLAQGQDDNES